MQKHDSNTFLHQLKEISLNHNYFGVYNIHFNDSMCFVCNTRLNSCDINSVVDHLNDNNHITRMLGHMVDNFYTLNESDKQFIQAHSDKIACLLHNLKPVNSINYHHPNCDIQSISNDLTRSILTQEEEQQQQQKQEKCQSIEINNRDDHLEHQKSQAIIDASESQSMKFVFQVIGQRGKHFNNEKCFVCNESFSQSNPIMQFKHLHSSRHIMNMIDDIKINSNNYNENIVNLNELKLILKQNIFTVVDMVRKQSKYTDLIPRNRIDIDSMDNSNNYRVTKQIAAALTDIINNYSNYYIDLTSIIESSSNEKINAKLQHQIHNLNNYKREMKSKFNFYGIYGSDYTKKECIVCNEYFSKKNQLRYHLHSPQHVQSIIKNSIQLSQLEKDLFNQNIQWIVYLMRYKGPMMRLSNLSKNHEEFATDIAPILDYYSENSDNFNTSHVTVSSQSQSQSHSQSHSQLSSINNTRTVNTTVIHRNVALIQDAVTKQQENKRQQHQQQQQKRQQRQIGNVMNSREIGIINKNRVRKHPTSYEIADRISKCKNFEEILAIVNDNKDKKKLHDISRYSAAIQRCSQLGLLSKFELILKMVYTRNVQRDKFFYAVLFSAFADHNLIENVYPHYYNRMIEKDKLTPTIYQANALLKACKWKGNLRLTNEICQNIIEKYDLEMNQGTYVALMSIYSRIGDYIKVENLLKELMNDSNIIVSTNVINVAMSVFARIGNIEKLLQYKKKFEFALDIYSYNTVITGYLRINDTENALKTYLEAVNKRKLKADRVTYVLLQRTYYKLQILKCDTNKEKKRCFDMITRDIPIKMNTNGVAIDIDHVVMMMKSLLRLKIVTTNANEKTKLNKFNRLNNNNIYQDGIERGKKRAGMIEKEKQNEIVPKIKIFKISWNNDITIGIFEKWIKEFKFFGHWQAQNDHLKRYKDHWAIDLHSCSLIEAIFRLRYIFIKESNFILDSIDKNGNQLVIITGYGAHKSGKGKFSWSGGIKEVIMKELEEWGLNSVELGTARKKGRLKIDGADVIGFLEKNKNILDSGTLLDKQTVSLKSVICEESATRIGVDEQLN